MNTKAYTDIEQSEKLAEILPLDSADMCYEAGIIGIKDIPTISRHANTNLGDIPCWSLAALFDVLPKTIDSHYKTMEYFDNSYHCSYMDEDGESILSTTADTLVDAVYKMVIKLNEK